MHFRFGWIGQDCVVPEPKSRSEDRLTTSEGGALSVPKIPKLSLREIYPAYSKDANLNTCVDPDCGNFGVAPEFSRPRTSEPGISSGHPTLPMLAKLRSNSAMMSLGSYKLHSSQKEVHRRTSAAFEYQGNPHEWVDRKTVRCRFDAGAGECGAAFELLSNDHLAKEVERLRDHNGALDGPRCPACATRYLAAPNELVLNGVHGRAKRSFEGDKVEKPLRVRLIHRQCPIRPGIRFSITLKHNRQRATTENVQILQALVNGAGINDLRRLLSPSGSGRRCGVSRIYDRIFWLEETLLAFERAQLQRWREKVSENGRKVGHYLAHDDLVLAVNWETTVDRRLTHLNCSTTADVRSGFVFRIDVDFDPTVDPATMFERVHGSSESTIKNLRSAYHQKALGRFTAPLMAFQRLTGRFDERRFFASAAKQHRAFKEKQLPRMLASTPKDLMLKAKLECETKEKIALIERVQNEYFDLGQADLDSQRTPFTGIMTRDLYTKAAHFLLLREMLPPGWFRLVTEMEGTLTRIIPHVFQDVIARDDFTWLAMNRPGFPRG